MILDENIGLAKVSKDDQAMVNQTYASAIRDIEKAEKKKAEFTKEQETPKHDEKPKNPEMVKGAKQMHLDESLFDELDEAKVGPKAGVKRGPYKTSIEKELKKDKLTYDKLIKQLTNLGYRVRPDYFNSDSIKLDRKLSPPGSKVKYIPIEDENDFATVKAWLKEKDFEFKYEPHPTTGDNYLIIKLKDEQLKEDILSSEAPNGSEMSFEIEDDGTIVVYDGDKEIKRSKTNPEYAKQVLTDLGFKEKELIKEDIRKYKKTWVENEAGDIVAVKTKNFTIRVGDKIGDDYVTGLEPETNTVYLYEDPDVDGGRDYAVEDVISWLEENAPYEPKIYPDDLMEGVSEDILNLYLKEKPLSVEGQLRLIRAARENSEIKDKVIEYFKKYDYDNADIADVSKAIKSYDFNDYFNLDTIVRDTLMDGIKDALKNPLKSQDLKEDLPYNITQEQAQKLVDEIVAIFGRIGGGLQDELDQAGFYVSEEDGKHIVKKKIKEDIDTYTDEVYNGYVVKKSGTSDNYFVYDNRGHVEDEAHKGQGYETKEEAIARANELEPGIAKELEIKESYKVINKEGKKVPQGGGFTSKEEAELFAAQYGEKDLKVVKESFEDEHLGSTEKVIEDGGEIIPDSVNPGPDAGIASQLNKLIRDEWEAIQGYNDAIVMAELEGFHDVAKVFKDIVNEENVHVGQLEQCMKLVSPNADSIVHGEIEAEGQLGEEPTPVEKEEDPEEGMHY